VNRGGEGCADREGEAVYERGVLTWFSVTRGLERASHKRTEGHRGHASLSDQFSKISLESVVSRDNYPTYMVKDGNVYKQTNKEIINALTR